MNPDILIQFFLCIEVTSRPTVLQCCKKSSVPIICIGSCKGERKPDMGAKEILEESFCTKYEDKIDSCWKSAASNEDE